MKSVIWISLITNVEISYVHYILQDNGAARDRYGVVIRSGRDRDREDRHWEGGRDLPSGKPFVWGETYGLSPSFLEGLGIAPPLVCRVFVANVSRIK